MDKSPAFTHSDHINALKRLRGASRVSIFGFPRLVADQAAMLSDRGWDCDPMRTNYALRVPFTDVVYQLGGAVIPSYLFQACKLLNKPIVKHWIGTDVLRAKEPIVQRQAAASFVKHWTVAPWLRTELRLAGIDATYVPIGSVSLVKPCSLPPAPLTVLSYMPGKKFEFYGGQTILSLAQTYADIMFLVVGNEGVPEKLPSNVQCLGFQSSMEVIYGRCHVLLRIARHDGLSHMILEALNYGRHAIWTHEFTGVLGAKNDDEAATHLRALRTELMSGALHENDIGRDYVRRNFSTSTTMTRISNELQAVVQRATSAVGQA
ncbi:MAG: hypothetical protein GIX02_08645 [Candidatus Eremiobacteraeota bacterium]|nr:hypothetical protein [Candidatus Eremiobacteraeota bacterium]